MTKAGRSALAFAIGTVLHLVLMVLLIRFAPDDRLDRLSVGLTATFNIALGSWYLRVAYVVVRGRGAGIACGLAITMWIISLGMYGGIGQFGLAQGFAVPRAVGLVMLAESIAWAFASVFMLMLLHAQAQLRSVSSDRPPSTPTRVE